MPDTEEAAPAAAAAAAEQEAGADAKAEEAAPPAAEETADDSKTSEGKGDDAAEAADAATAEAGAGAGSGAGAGETAAAGGGHAALPSDFYYAKKALKVPRLPMELPRNLGALYHSFGYDFSRLNNLHLVSESELMYIVGNTVQFYDLKTNAVRYLMGKDGRGVGSLCVHPSGKYFAMAEKGESPNVYIYEYPSLRVYRICRKGTERTYCDVNFSAQGNKMVTVGGFPDFLLTVWDWPNERIILRSKAFSQEVFNARFSPDDDGQLTTSGQSHIRFWRMASTFTGLKLQGDIGKFGKVELSDIHAFAQLPDGKVLSGSENGALLLWDGHFIKLSVSRTDGSPAHNGTIKCLLLDREANKFVSAGDDGRLCFWDFTAIDTAELEEDVDTFPLDPSQEIQLPAGAQATAFVQGKGFFIVQDTAGVLWRVNPEDAAEPVKLLSGHAGAINSVDVSPIAHISVTAGSDGYVRCWDFVSKQELVSASFNAPVTALAHAPKSIDATGRTIIAGFEDGVVRVLLRTKAELKRVHVTKPHNGRITCMAYSPSGEFMATGGADSRVFILGIESMASTPESHSFSPIGFVELGSKVSSLNWSKDSDKLLAATDEGVAEIEVPMNTPNTAHSFELQLGVKKHQYTPPPKRVIVQKTEEEEKKEKEAAAAAAGAEGEEGGEAEEEKVREELVPADPGTTLAAMYVPGTALEFLVCVSKDGCNGIHELEFDNPHTLRSLPAAAAGTSYLGTSISGRFIICGGVDGSVWIRPANALRQFWRVAAHDGDSGRIQRAVMSHDDKFIISVGADGTYFVHQVDPEALLAAAEEGDKTAAAQPWLAAATETPKLVRPTTPDPSQLIALSEAVDKPDELATEFLSVQQAAELGSTKFEEVPSSAAEEKHDESKEAAVEEAEDITDPSAYSIQDAKLKTEEDNRRKAAEEKKDKVREVVQQLQHDFAALRARNELQVEGVRLTEEELIIDKHLHDSVLQQGDEACAETEREMAWECAKRRIALDKLRDKFLNKMAFEGMRLHALQTPQSVRSFRTMQLSSIVQESLAEIRLLLQNDSGPAAATAGAGAGAGALAAAGASMRRLGDSKRDGGKDGEVSRHGWQVRKEMRLKRRANLEAIAQQEPGPDAEDPADVSAVHEAETNMGDYKLKTDKDYEVPEEKRVDAGKKRRQMVLLEDSMFNIRMQFNERFLQLRNVKQMLVDSIKANNVRLREINGELGTQEELWEPEMPESEFPGRRDTVTDDDRKEHGFQPTAGPEDGAAEQGAGAGAGAGAGSGAATDTAAAAEQAGNDASNNNNSTGAASAEATPVAALPIIRLCETTTEGEPSELEEQERWAYMRQLSIEKEVLLRRQRKQVETFDDAIYALRRERLRLDADLKAAELRLLLQYRELQLLRELARRDEALNRKLNKARADKASIGADVMECKQSLSEKKADIEVWQQKDAMILSEFHALVGETHPAAAALLKIFKRKLKRNRKHGDDEDSEESDEEFDDDDEDFDDEDEMEDDACPPNCDQTLYDKVLELREKRLDQEEVLADLNKLLDDLKKAHDRNEQRERQVDKELVGTNKEIQAFQTEKQRLLNQFQVTVTLMMSQVMMGSREVPAEGVEEQEAAAEAGEEVEPYQVPTQLPGVIDKYLVFARNTVNRLKTRIIELGVENKKLKRGFKDLGRQQTRLSKERRLKNAQIEAAKEKRVDLQMLKFGQIIDLDSLDKMTASKSLEEIEARIAVQEAANMSEVGKAKDSVVKAQGKLTQVTRENTTLLEKIGELTATQQKLEKELNAAGGVHVTDGGPSQRQEAEERARLLQLVKLQAKEMDALKAEIGMLRRKGGHVYTPAVAPPSAGAQGSYMGDTGGMGEPMQQ